jgi:hypothetical protein
VSDAPAHLVITGCTALVHDDHAGIGFEENAERSRPASRRSEAKAVADAACALLA